MRALAFPPGVLVVRSVTNMLGVVSHATIYKQVRKWRIEGNVRLMNRKEQTEEGAHKTRTQLETVPPNDIGDLKRLVAHTAFLVEGRCALVPERVMRRLMKEERIKVRYAKRKRNRPGCIGEMTLRSTTWSTVTAAPKNPTCCG